MAPTLLALVMGLVLAVAAWMFIRLNVTDAVDNSSVKSDPEAETTTDGNQA